MALVEAKARLPRIDFSNHRVILDAAPRGRVPKAAAAMLEAALDIRIRVI